MTLKCLKPDGIPENLRHPKTLGDHLKARRTALGLFQRDVAKLLGTDQFSVINWEKGRTEPTVRFYPAIRAFLGYDPYPTATTDGERLRRWRTVRGLSIRAAAKQANVDESTWAEWETKENLKADWPHILIGA